MVALQISAPSEPDRQIVIRDFPFRIGRSEGNHFRTSAAGVWAEHLVLDFDPAARAITAASLPGAVTLLNGQKLSTQKLRGGDILQLGACKISFSLAAPPQSSLRPREIFTWFLPAAVTATQAVLIFLLVSR